MSVLPIGRQINVQAQTFVIQSELGHGAFGTVYMVTDWQQKPYALKAVICNDSNGVSKVISEVNTLVKARHERIVQFFMADKKIGFNSYLYLILTECCFGGNLNSRLNSSSSLETNLKWISQLSEALSYLHSLNPPIVHRDLKADNVLLTDPVLQDLKLGDFGLAREYLAMKNYGGSPQSAQTYYMTYGCGTLHWMAPECFRYHYTEKADVFSLGGIFYAILIRDFIQISSTKKMYGVFFTCPNGKYGLGFAMAAINPNAKVSLPIPTPYAGTWANSMATMHQLIGNMLDFHPHNRPSASQVNAIVQNIIRSIQAGIFQPNWRNFQSGS